jgi:hypothetical protein
MQPEQNPFMELKTYLKDFGLDLGLLISGLFGAILLLSKEGIQKNKTRSIFSLIGGAASANYLTPLVMNVMNIKESGFDYGIAFLLGFLGLRGIEFICTFKWLPDPKDLFEYTNPDEAEEVKEKEKAKPKK